MQTIYLAGGCFWGVQKYFDQFDGVIATEVGYANGPIHGACHREQVVNNCSADLTGIASIITG